MDTINSFLDDDDENQSELIKRGVLAFIILVIIACEVVNISQFADVFRNQSPLIQGIVVFGIGATGLSILLGLAAKLKWIKGGSQSAVAWGFFGLELIIFCLNTGLAFQHLIPEFGNSLDSWRNFSLLSGPIAVVGWILLYLLDPGNIAKKDARDHMLKVKQARMKFEKHQAMADLGLERLTYQTMLKAKQETAAMHIDYVKQYMKSDQVLDHIDTSARRTAEQVAKLITGHHPLPLTKTAAAKVVDSQPVRKALPPTTNKTQPTQTEQIKTNKKELPARQEQEEESLLDAAAALVKGIFSARGAKLAPSPVGREDSADLDEGSYEEEEQTTDELPADQLQTTEPLQQLQQNIGNRIRQLREQNTGNFERVQFDDQPGQPGHVYRDDVQQQFMAGSEEEGQGARQQPKKAGRRRARASV